MLLIGLLGLIGIVGSFALAWRSIASYYPPEVVGSGPPVGTQVAAFGSALLIALLTFYLVVRSLRNLSAKPASDTTEDAVLNEDEELPD